MTVPSWMFVRAPMRMMFMSPRTRQWNQIPVSGPISTSPITAAEGATNASGAILGVTPSSEKIGPVPVTGTAPPRDDSGIHRLPRGHARVQAEHEADVLDGG